jgi:putative MATE family efflux protein
MGFFNAESDVANLAVSYADIMFDYMPFFLLIFLSAAIMQGLGDTITPLIIMACTNAINIFLNYTLIFGMWGFPELGIQGAAIGSVVARAAGSLAIIAILISGRYRMILKLPDFRPYLSEFWSILRLGIPNSLQSILRNINVMLLYRILSITELPTVAQASLGVGFLSEAMAFIPLIGLFTATGAMVGQNIGAEQPDRAEQAAWVALRTALVLMTIACIVFLTIPESIIRLFNDDPAVISSGSWYLRINAITQIFQANFILVGVLRGAGDSIRPLLTHITGQWIIRLPLAYLLAKYSGLEEWGVWIAMATSSAIECMIYFWLFRRGYWKHIRIPSSADPDDV